MSGRHTAWQQAWRQYKGPQTSKRACRSQSIGVLELEIACEPARYPEFEADAVQLGFLEGIASDHKHREKPRMEGAHPRPRTVRLGKEIASLPTDLPLSPTSSVFVRVDEQNVTLWRALITGSSLGLRRSQIPEGSQCLRPPHLTGILAALAAESGKFMPLTLTWDTIVRASSPLETGTL